MNEVFKKQIEEKFKTKYKDMMKRNIDDLLEKLEDDFENILRDAGITPNVALETGSVQAIKQFTMSGLGICLLPQVAVSQEVESKKLIPLNWAGQDFGIISQVIYHKDKWKSPALKEFINLSKKFLINKNI